jgi:copper chaperone
MLQVITVDNLKCGGCATTVIKSLENISGITGVHVDVTRGLVSFQGDAIRYDEAVQRLDALGYPLRRPPPGLHAAAAPAKSCTSRDIGRVNK